MSENNIPQTSTPQLAPSVPVDQTHPIAQVTTTPTASVTATAAAATAAINNSMNGGEQLPCQWVGCTEKSPTAELLYEHVCERHVGRKSTNNLNLTCQWGSCNTTTVKRDHITSHIRVHVPLKPHKCDFCGKAFKRPQDLKKHVKTHADDSEIRSPEPGLKHHHPDMMFPQNPKGYAAATHYFESPINGVPNQAYTHGAPQYYQTHQAPPPPANPHSYGNVYYALSQGHDGAPSYDRKRGYDALNEFFGDLKRRQFDPNSYAAVGQRLLGLQALQLPILNGPVPEYQPMPTGVAVGGGGGYSPGGSQAPAYHLPPMSNVRTKNDLINIDQFLEQMQNTIYESDENVAAAGVAQPGAHYVHPGMHYRATHSPPTQLPPSHASATSSAPMMQAHSPSVGTPALTPPSSAQSYTSNRSPISMHNHRVSPPHESGPGMYPRLPSASMSDSMGAGYPTASGAAPPSTLGAFDNDDRRRYTGGTLQRARPADRQVDNSQMDISHDSKADGERTPTKEHMNISESLIDPALSGTSSDPDQEAAQRTAQAATEVAERDVNVAWVEKVRLLENLRRLVSELLEADLFTPGSGQESNSSTPIDGAMEGIEIASARASSEPSKEEFKSEPVETVSYPTLRGLDEDGDAKMPGDDE
ncbi:Zinc finger C2H2 [Penicillium verhagenii]|uniref:Zinc finger C2H2 n=1 Tax=Penicillium verhagenii TaxID=1562060 RepID=UPI00254575CB|nr:Zinc finger C2H2 [Penicillium verhagenii]KAJ5918441.1 Zinc finger C2H2 [Penicillium verhagenii]